MGVYGNSLFSLQFFRKYKTILKFMFIKTKLYTKTKKKKKRRNKGFLKQKQTSHWLSQTKIDKSLAKNQNHKKC